MLKNACFGAQVSKKEVKLIEFDQIDIFHTVYTNTFHLI